jgi:short subunit dehydrogenase-like uncharacterized protein
MSANSSSGASRPYDIVVFGATGFTGQKVAEYLARNAPAEVRWAIAGRSRNKLEAVKAKLVGIDGKCRDVGVVEASVDDASSLAAMARAARVVLTTVGPFIDYGEPVVRACVDNCTDYVDSTGEPHFVELLLARYSSTAESRDVRIVPSCGFDSIPADLGVFFTVQRLPAGQPIRMSGYMKFDAAFSGGTEQSAIKSLVPPKDPIRVPARAATNGRKVGFGKPKVQRRPDMNGWSAPLPTIDASVVVRSAKSIDRYGPEFSYAHHVIHPSFLIMLAAFWFFGSLAFWVRFPPFRAFFLRVAKKSGIGPSDERMKRSWFKMRFEAECGGQTIKTEVSGGDPGYGETSKMLAESALCLAQDRARLPKRAGVLTPVEAMAEPLLERLTRAGLRFEVLGAP